MFNNLSDESKIWVYGFKDELNTQQKGIVAQALDNFVSQWKSHGDEVGGSYKLVESRFVILAVNESISGCSIDSSVQVFKDLKNYFGLDALNLNLIFYRDQNSIIQSVPRSDFAKLVSKKEIKADTSVFNTSFSTLGALRKNGFETKFSESWHYKVFTL